MFLIMMYWSAFVLFCLAALAVLHSYVFYPQLLKWLAINKRNNEITYTPEDRLPFLSVIMSLYNEEKVIGEKLISLLNQDYAGQVEVYIGSDGSNDKTNQIVAQLIEQQPNVHFFPFEQRRGKPEVINHLVRLACAHYPAGNDHILLITDASVMLSPQVSFQLVKHFKNTHIAVVDAFMVHTGMSSSGISRAENQYISGEVSLKYLESIVWRKMIGPFGGCYALRSNYYSAVPDNFLVDDFYITMCAFEQGADAINEPMAVCHEPVSHDWQEEYRRKSRISAGNFQNMFRFRNLWWPPFSTLGFAFFSHKILRWLGPFFLMIMGLSALIMACSANLLHQILFVGFFGVMVCLPVADFLLLRLGINLLPVRAVRYFLLMNIALFQGFFRFLNGIRSNVWEPTKRN